MQKRNWCRSEGASVHSVDFCKPERFARIYTTDLQTPLEIYTGRFTPFLEIYTGTDLQVFKNLETSIGLKLLRKRDSHRFPSKKSACFQKMKVFWGDLHFLIFAKLPLVDNVEKAMKKDTERNWFSIELHFTQNKQIETLTTASIFGRRKTLESFVPVPVFLCIIAQFLPRREL